MKKLIPFSLTVIFFLVAAISGCGGGNSGELNLTNYTPGQLRTYTVDGVSFNMRYAPNGSFITDDYEFSGEPTVEIANAFWVAETEVTYKLWYKVRTWATDASARGTNVYTFANAGREGSPLNAGAVGDAPKRNEQYPVTNIAWRDAMVWCNALSEMVGFKPAYKNGGVVVRDATNGTLCDGVSQPNASNKGFRLPTSGEWQLAARYKNGTDWTPGNFVSGGSVGLDHPDMSKDFGKYAWHSRNSYLAAHPVGEKTANALNIKDMSGNVWEWCFESYPGDIESRIWRGGSWEFEEFFSQIKSVGAGDPEYSTFDDVGFRFVSTQ